MMHEEIECLNQNELQTKAEQRCRDGEEIRPFSIMTYFTSLEHTRKPLKDTCVCVCVCVCVCEREQISS